MKKISFLLLICLSSLASIAQLSISGNFLKISKKPVNVVIFDSISNQIISYAGTNVRFYKYDDATSNSNPIYPSLSPEDGTGYIVKVDDVAKDTIWVIDYSKYKPNIKSIVPDMQSINPCKDLNIIIDASIPKLIYKTPIGAEYELERSFKLKYYTLSWKDDLKKWDADSLSFKAIFPSTTVTAPLCDTKFTIVGDQYTLALRIDSTLKRSVNYSAISVAAHLASIVTERNENNEAQPPKNNSSEISYSTPMDIQFLSNANEPVATYYKWGIYKDGQLIINRTDKDHRYTFTDYGKYVVRLNVSNANCSYSDSIIVNAIDAKIQVTNVFTPNGDNLNDEFRVSYKSLLSFECWVYNRWGRKVFYWNDPQKGWDGKINGKDAAEGAYFYVIKATGYGLDPKKPNPKIKQTITIKGNVNLLRGKQ